MRVTQTGLDREAPLAAPCDLLLVGNAGVQHVGAHLREAAGELGVRLAFVDTNQAFAGPVLLAKVNWWLRGRRPSRLSSFSQQVVRTCLESRPLTLLTTGFAPVDRQALKVLGTLG